MKCFVFPFSHNSFIPKCNPLNLQCWEQGIPLLEELANQYRTCLFDYQKLSEVLRRQASFYEKILSGKRYDHEYFRVGFYGLGLPLFVRVSSAIFIYLIIIYKRCFFTNAYC